MEVLTRPLPHQDAPMDLSTTAHRMLSRSRWTHPTQVECVVEPRNTVTQEAPSKYIPIPKKRHCHAPLPKKSLRRHCHSPSPIRSSPPSSSGHRTRHSLSPETSRKRARMESPKPSDLCCDIAAQRAPSADRHNAVPASPTTTGVRASDSSGGGGGSEWLAKGAGLVEANGEVVGASEGFGQSVMKPRQRSHPPSAGSSSTRSPPNLLEESNEGMPPAHLLTALLHMQNSTLSQGMLPNALKDTEALLSAVHQSQMIYYSYCSQLIHTLRAKQIEQQQQHLHHQQQQLQHQHRLYQQKQSHSHYQRTQERPCLSNESETERHTPLEEARCYESENTEEDLHSPEDEALSILRTRLNSQVRRIRLRVVVYHVDKLVHPLLLCCFFFH